MANSTEKETVETVGRSFANPKPPALAGGKQLADSANHFNGFLDKSRIAEASSNRENCGQFSQKKETLQYDCSCTVIFIENPK